MFTKLSEMEVTLVYWIMVWVDLPPVHHLMQIGKEKKLRVIMYSCKTTYHQWMLDKVGGLTSDHLHHSYIYPVLLYTLVWHCSSCVSWACCLSCQVSCLSSLHYIPEHYSRPSHISLSDLPDYLNSQIHRIYKWNQHYHCISEHFTYPNYVGPVPWCSDM